MRLQGHDPSGASRGFSPTFLLRRLPLGSGPLLEEYLLSVETRPLPDPLPLHPTVPDSMEFQPSFFYPGGPRLW